MTQAIPPNSHDLIFLIGKINLTLPQTYLEFIGKINNASIPTRYPDDLQQTIRDYTEEVTREYLRQTGEVIQWLKQHSNLQT